MCTVQLRGQVELLLYVCVCGGGGGGGGGDYKRTFQHQEVVTSPW